MKVLLLTQDDPFFLGKSINHLLDNLSKEHEVVACVVFDPSPFGKKRSPIQKVQQTIDVFGFGFFLRYALKAVLNKFDSSTKVSKVLKKFGVPEIRLQSNVNSAESLKLIASFKPDLLVSVTGNQIFKRPLIELAPKGCINLHTALLPKYRGIMPSFWVLKNDERETGLSVFFVDEGIDSGPIIVQKRINLEGHTQESLIVESKIMGMDAIIEAIELIDNDSVELIANPDSESTYFKFPTKQDVQEFRRIGKKFY